MTAQRKRALRPAASGLLVLAALLIAIFLGACETGTAPAPTETPHLRALLQGCRDTHAGAFAPSIRRLG